MDRDLSDIAAQILRLCASVREATLCAHGQVLRQPCSPEREALAQKLLDLASCAREVFNETNRSLEARPMRLKLIEGGLQESGG